MKQALETRHYNGGAGGFIIIPGSCSVLAAGAVVCGAASEFARPDRTCAGRARSAPPAGETHTPVIGVDDVWGAALVGIGGDEADGLIEDGKQVPVKACQPGARDPVFTRRAGDMPDRCNASSAYMLPTPASIDWSRSNGLMADLRPAVRSTNISLVNAGSMASGPSRPVNSSSESARTAPAQRRMSSSSMRRPSSSVKV